MIHFNEVQAIFLGDKRQHKAISIPYVNPNEVRAMGNWEEEPGVYVLSGGILFFINDEAVVNKLKSQYGLGGE